MFIEERHQSILALLEQNGKILVKDLSKTFNVSESMIRKDLQLLEKQHLLKRTYGGAIRSSQTPYTPKYFRSRVEENTDLKQIIAEKAFGQIEDYDTVFLDASTTSYMIAKLIIAQDLPITIITNMLEISSLIPPASKIHFAFIGGDYHPLVGGSVGSYAIKQIKSYRCSKAFIGCTGIDLNDGSVHTAISEDASTKEAIMDISSKLYLIMLNEKFEPKGSFVFSQLSDFYALITESSPDPTITAQIETYHLNVIT